LTLPLNSDRFLRFTFLQPNTPTLMNTLGNLDGAGRATAWLNLLPGDLSQHVGGHIDFVAFLPGNPDRVTNVVGFEVTP